MASTTSGLTRKGLKGKSWRKCQTALINWKLIFVFITNAYITKIKGLGPYEQDESYSCEQYLYVIKRKGSGIMIVVLMEKAKLTGSVGFNLCNHLYHSNKDDSQLSQQCARTSVLEEIRRRLQPSTRTSGTDNSALVIRKDNKKAPEKHQSQPASRKYYHICSLLLP